MSVRSYQVKLSRNGTFHHFMSTEATEKSVPHISDQSPQHMLWITSLIVSILKKYYAKTLDELIIPEVMLAYFGSGLVFVNTASKFKFKSVWFRSISFTWL